ncbi:MAG: DUF2752 domain-containing protein [Ignavibacteriaceae bacterium]|jgi:hypothetical protein
MIEQSVKGGGITFAGRNFNLLSAAGKVVGIEALIWIAALIFLALIEPAESTHFTICPFSVMGFDFCPGCGLGRSVSYVLHGEITNSLSLHPLGIFALIVLTTRVISLIKINWSNYGKRFSINARS